MIKYTIVSGDIDTTGSFSEYLEKKLEKIETLLSSNAKADAKVVLEKVSSDYKLTITLIVDAVRGGAPAQAYKASDTNKDAYATIDAVEDKLKRQIRKTLTTINRDDRRG